MENLTLKLSYKFFASNKRFIHLIKVGFFFKHFVKIMQPVATFAGRPKNEKRYQGYRDERYMSCLAIDHGLPARGM
jgi:hypothetical protein